MASIHPGETYLPRASISVVPCSGTRPILAKRPSLIATSARIQGLPAPSSTRPLRITTSKAADAREAPLAERDAGSDAHAESAAHAMAAGKCRKARARSFLDPGVWFRM